MNTTQKKNQLNLYKKNSLIYEWKQSDVLSNTNSIVVATVFLVKQNSCLSTNTCISQEEIIFNLKIASTAIHIYYIDTFSFAQFMLSISALTRYI